MRAAPRRIVLWRHGRTAWNLVNRAQGQAEVPLDEVGREQAHRAAPELARTSPVMLLSSDLVRARETAEALVPLVSAPLQVDERLREVHVGLREGFTAEEFRQQHPDVHRRFSEDPEFTVPGAENPTAAGHRVAGVLREVGAALPPAGTAVVVGHGAALRHGLLAFFDAPAAMHHLFAGMGNCAFTVLVEHETEGWQISEYNSTTLQFSVVHNVDDRL